MAASASAAKRTFTNLARGNGEATGYHMRHDPSALPRCGIRGDLPALRHSARRHRPALSATSRAPRRSRARGGTHRRPGPAHRRRIVRLVRPALRGREPRGRGRAGGGRVRRAFRAQRLYAALREYERARGQSRPTGDEHALRPRHPPRGERRSGSARHPAPREVGLPRRDFDLRHGNSRSRGNTRGNRRAAQFEAERADRAPGDSRQDEGLRPGAPERPTGGIRRVGGPGTAAVDARREAVGRQGRLNMALVAAAFGPSHIAQLVTDEAITRRFSEVQDAMKRLKSEIASAKLDILIIVGDDQHELFQDRHMPSIGIYYGESIRNAGRANAKRFSWPEEWYNRAQMRRFEDEGDIDYPCHRPLALG